MDNSTIFLVDVMEKINWSAVQYFMPTEWNRLTREIYHLSYSQKSKFKQNPFRYSVSQKCTRLTA